MTGSPRLLYLAYYFRPARTSGTVRTWNTASHLARLGWSVSVLTPDPRLWRCPEDAAAVDAEVAREKLHRIYTGHRWRLLNQYLTSRIGGLPFCRRLAQRLCWHSGISEEVGWSGPAIQACRRLRPGDVDAILATGSPFNAFTVARQLSARLRCPYLLDYRDGWTVGNPHAAARRARRDRKAERSALGDCAGVTVVSHSWGAALDQAFGVGAKLHVVSNGYDPREMEQVKAHDFGHFALVYAGAFYWPVRVIDPVFAALAALDRDAGPALPEWRFHYYGPSEAHVRKEAARFGLLRRVAIHGNVCRAESLAATKGAGLSVVVASVGRSAGRDERGIITGKLFESIGLASPMLVVAPDGSDIDAVLAHAGLGRRFTGDDVEGMAGYVAAVMRGARPATKDPQRYAWPSLARQLDEILREAIEREAKGAPVVRFSARHDAGASPDGAPRKAARRGSAPARAAG